MGQLPRSLKISTATLGSVQVMGGANRLVAKPVVFPGMRVALWSVLILAVLILGFMAYLLFADQSHRKL